MSGPTASISNGKPVNIHVCISGFTQSERRIHGLTKLCEKLHSAGFNNCVSRVMLRPWNAKWSEVAESIWSIGELHAAEVVVNIYAYSWGMGWGAVQLSRELEKRGITVHIIVACDGVYRHPLLCLRWLSLLQRDGTFSPVIRIPGNVREVRPLHQTMNTPQGHRIVGGKDFSGQIRQSVEIHRTHPFMDDAPQFHALALAAAEQLKAVN